MTRTGCPASLAACGSFRAARIWCDTGTHAGQAHAAEAAVIPGLNHRTRKGAEPPSAAPFLIPAAVRPSRRVGRLPARGIHRSRPRRAPWRPTAATGGGSRRGPTVRSARGHTGRSGGVLR